MFNTLAPTRWLSLLISDMKIEHHVFMLDGENVFL